MIPIGERLLREEEAVKGWSLGIFQKNSAKIKVKWSKLNGGAPAAKES